MVPAEEVAAAPEEVSEEAARAAMSEEARERLGLEDLHTGAWDPQLDDIEDVPWRNYVEGEPLPPDR